MEGKKRKLNTEAELNEMRKSAREGHASFTDDTFAGVGGASALSSILSQGASSISADGSGMFSIAKKALSADLNMGPDAADAKNKKKKRYDIESVRATTQDVMAAKTKEIQDKVQTILAVAKTAVELANDVADTVEGVAKWRGILVLRIEYLTMVA